MVSTKIIPMVMAMVINALDKSDFSMINSLILRITFYLKAKSDASHI
jgi:hypothetical protein